MKPDIDGIKPERNETMPNPQLNSVPIIWEEDSDSETVEDMELF
jgi:hypothetical protein